MKDISVCAVTQMNPALAPLTFERHGDLCFLPRGRGEFAENLIEFAGRVCYRSTARMGSREPSGCDFIAGRVREGHEDILEHAWATLLWLSGDDDPHRLLRDNPYLQIREVVMPELQRAAVRAYLLSANVRVWLALLRQGESVPEMAPILCRRLPQVFAEFARVKSNGLPPDLPWANARPSQQWVTALGPRQAGAARVTLMGFNHVWGYPDLSSASFLIEGVIRALTHQLVRHRLGSFSQESQRYVDMSKGGWQPVIPPAILANPGALARMQLAWDRLEEDYRVLRDEYKIRKEDARFLLPNATETRLVVTMGLPGWRHFARLRAVDKAAQWEIRAVGGAILELLHAYDPITFADLWQKHAPESVKEIA